MKPRVIAMIPARLGSQRVVRKNLRMIDGKPLLAYVVETAMKAAIFDEVYVNSESEKIGALATELGAKFYQRPEEFSSHASTNDQFALDFMKNVKGDILIQILPTSPFLSVDEMKRFTAEMLRGGHDTLISVEQKQIGCLYEGKPLNFTRTKPNPPSQTMTPVEAYATALMGWRYESFQDHSKRFGSAYHGGDGKIGTFELRGLSTLDIDREEDFQLAEAIMVAKKHQKAAAPEYWGEEAKDRVEVDVPSILKKDGVEVNDLLDANHEIVNLADIFAKFDSSKSWSKRVIDTESNSMTIISQLPGEGNRLHYHPAWNEWWYIVDGEWTWDIEGEKKIVKKGDIVLVRKNRKHKITASGTKPAVRMAVSRADVEHVYPDGKNSPASKEGY